MTAQLEAANVANYLGRHVPEALGLSPASVVVTCIAETDLIAIAAMSCDGRGAAVIGSKAAALADLAGWTAARCAELTAMFGDALGKD